MVTYEEKIPENFHRQIVSLNIVGELFQELAQTKVPVFLGGDFNIQMYDKSYLVDEVNNLTEEEKDK